MKSAIQELKVLSIKTLLTVVAAIVPVILAAFVGGRASKEIEPALSIGTPFSFRYVTATTTNDFERVLLTEDIALGKPEAGRRYLRMRHMQSSFDIIPIGIIVAQDFKIKAPMLSLPSLVSHADADEVQSFNFGAHNYDTRCKEWWDHQNRVMHRMYWDGCELIYQVDANGRSIPASFRWIRYQH